MREEQNIALEKLLIESVEAGVGVEEGLVGPAAEIVNWVLAHARTINALENFNIEIHSRGQDYLSFKVSSLFVVKSPNSSTPN